MSTLPDNEKYGFEVHASVIFQLGESLISDETQALVELIKNAYDADAGYVKVTIETTAPNDIENSRYPNARGYIRIEDNGHGMDVKTIKRGWLTVSNSLKREMKASGKTTATGRTPLGDKGLGRLGAQRLGNNLEIFTKPEDSTHAYHVAFSWNDFYKVEKLADVHPYGKTFPSTRKKGTVLLISDLKNPEYWKEKEETDASKNFRSEFFQLISPYKGVQNFKVSVSVNGRSLEFEEISEQILRSSQVRYVLNFDGNIFRVDGQVRLSFFYPQKQEDQDIFRELVEADNGQEFLKFLLLNSLSKDNHLEQAKEEGWFLKYYLSVPLDSFKPALGNQIVANPGSFKGQIDAFDLSFKNAQQQDVFNATSAYRKFIKKISGIRVYRDGFGIRVDQDWLKFGEQWTSARSYYGLKPVNTLGYIALSAKENALLEETTDREGFKDTPYYRIFFQMLQKFVWFSGYTHNFMRRGWIKFRNEHQEKIAQIVTGTTPEAISQQISESLLKARKYTISIEQLQKTLSSQTLEQSIQKEITRLLSQLNAYIQEISALDPKSKVLTNQLEQLREQLVQLYETASLGLTAEALSHEIHYIADRLATQTQSIGRYLKQKGNRDAKVIAFIEYIVTSVAALRKQLSHLAPSLKYVREKREEIHIPQFFAETKEYYRVRFEQKQLETQITSIDEKNFMIFMNKGKLTQVIDNIFLNSEYWLCEDLRRGILEHGIISVEIAKPFIRIFDNGRGVEPSVETSLFEPFVTMKEHGRGLGLFIVRQLLDSEGCTISLLPVRNQQNHLYKFEIDLSGGLNGKH